MKLRFFVISLAFVCAAVFFSACGADNEKHRHVYGKWTRVTEASCTQSGLERRVCACGGEETRVIPAAGHVWTWSFDDKNHWETCAVCRVGREISAHTDEKSCKVCGYPLFEYELRGGEYTVTGAADNKITAANVPSVYNGLPVTSVGRLAFTNCGSLKFLNLPDSVTKIGDRAFYGCPIERAQIPSVAAAHIKNAKLVHVEVTYGEIAENAFYGCGSLKSAKIRGATSLGDCAFYGCGSLSKVLLSDGLIRIGERAFYGCSSLESIELPQSVVTVGDNAFEGCVSLKDMLIPAGAEFLGNYAFYNCGGLGEAILGGGLKFIGKCAFKNCPSLKSVIFENTQGWRISSVKDGEGEEADVKDVAINAKNLTSVFSDKYWKRN